jgi:lipoate-protein ligase A
VELSANDFKRIDIKDFRVIPYMVLHGRTNMAIDHYFAASDRSNFAIIRFYGWKPCCISLGYHQKISDLNRDAIKLRSIEVVKRPTGGSAVFHCDELTYSVIFSRDVVNHRILYSIIHNVIAKALISIGYNVYLEDSIKTERTEICYNRAAESEIKFNKKKLVGSAQRLYPTNILQHGSILFSNEQHEMINFLNFDEHEKEYYKSELEKRSTSLININKNIIINKHILIDHIVDQLNFYFNNSLYYKYLTSKEFSEISKYEDLFVVE